MENNNSKIIWILAGLVIVASIIALVLKEGKSTDQLSNPESSTTIEETSAKEKESIPSKKTTSENTVSNLTYTQAVEKYKDRRIQFDENCQAYPNTVTYKDNTGIMLDNRSSKARTIKVGTSYSVGAYGWKIITLSDTGRTAETFLVDCDTAQNVATILVQE